jgi:hypothetical protein
MQPFETPRTGELGLDAFVTHWRRRTFLRGTLLMAGAASSGLLMGCQPAGKSFSTSGNTGAPMLMRVLNRLKSIALPDSPPLVSVNSIAIEKNIDGLFALMDPQILNDLDMAASLFEYGSSVLGWHFAKFSSLTDNDAIEYVDRWQNGVSMQRGIVTVFKKLLYASYWRDPATWPAVGFDGPVSEQWGLPSLGNAPLPDEIIKVEETV